MIAFCDCTLKSNGKGQALPFERTNSFIVMGLATSSLSKNHLSQRGFFRQLRETKDLQAENKKEAAALTGLFNVHSIERTNWPSKCKRLSKKTSSSLDSDSYLFGVIMQRWSCWFRPQIYSCNHL